MNEEETLEKYAEDMGWLIINFQALECLVRMFLTKMNDETEYSTTNLCKGKIVEENSFTNHHGLKKLIKQYNEKADYKSSFCVDSLVCLRNALAHGRVLRTEKAPYQAVIYNFEKQKKGNKGNGGIKVIFEKKFDKDYIRESTQLVRDAISKVKSSIDDLSTDTHQN